MEIEFRYSFVPYLKKYILYHGAETNQDDHVLPHVNSVPYDEDAIFYRTGLTFSRYAVLCKVSEKEIRSIIKKHNEDFENHPCHFKSKEKAQAACDELNSLLMVNLLSGGV